MRGKGRGRVVLRGRFWSIAYYAPGRDGRSREVWESTGSEDRAAAEAKLEERIREVRNDRDGIRSFSGPKAERLTINNLLDSLRDDWQQRQIKSLRQSLNHMKPVREFFGRMRAVAVTTGSARKYIAARREDGRSDAKINRECEILNAAYRLAVRERRVTQQPYIPHLTESNARTSFFESDEMARLVEHLEEPVNAMSRFAYVSGWRLSEIRLLRFENLDRNAKEVRIDDSKNGEGRVLPLDDETWKIFEELWQSRSYETWNGVTLSEFVFHDQGRPISESRYKRLWKRGCKKAGLKGKLFHDFRRTAARNMLRAGVPQAVAMKVTGHKTDSMFRRYSIVSPDDKRDALKKQLEFLRKERETNKTNVADFQRAKENTR